MVFVNLQISDNFSSRRGFFRFRHNRLFCTFAAYYINILIGVMVTQLIFVWALGVVLFFALWAILAKVIKYISEKKNKSKNTEI